MAGDGGLHSRVVGGLKVALPLLALAILSTVFFVSNRVDPNAVPAGAGVDIEDRMRQPRMTQPAYSGVTADGSALTLKAAEARPSAEDPGGAGSAAGLTGRMTMPEGTTADLQADQAQVDTPANLIRLTGNVVMQTSAGYLVKSDAMSAALDRTRMDSPGPVQAVGPPGQITADSMVLTADAEKPGTHVLVFNGGVKLIYQPGT